MMRYSVLLIALSTVLCPGCRRSRESDIAPQEFVAPEVAQEQKQMGETVSARDLDLLLRDLFGEDQEKREAASKNLFDLRAAKVGLTTEQGLKVLRLAAKKYPFEKPDPAQISEDLVALAGKNPRLEYAGEIVELFDHFSDHAKTSALVILAQLEDKRAAQAYMQIVRKHAKARKLPQIVTGPLAMRPRHADVYFPELLDYAELPELSDDIYRLCLSYADAGLLSAQSLAPYLRQVLVRYERLTEKLRPAQRTKGIAWMWEDAYSEARFAAGLLLDLLAHFPPDSVEKTLRQALDYEDTRLKYFAVSSLLRLGKEVDRKHTTAIAAKPEMRNWLFDLLQKNGKLESYPEQFRTQKAFAESDMVNWLTYPTELGRVPDEIELMKVVPIDTGLRDGVYDYYLFRFRTIEPHWAAKDGWMAGVSGPFRRSDSPTTNALGDTFSTFAKWDTKAAEEHVGDIRELMQRWREHHQQVNDAKK